jgi:hypothetical protein
MDLQGEGFHRLEVPPSDDPLLALLPLPECFPFQLAKLN